MTGSAWPVVIVGVLGTLGTLSGVWLTGRLTLRSARLSQTWQREAQIEDRRATRGDLRRAAYLELLTRTQRALDATTEWMSSTGSAISDPKERLETYARDLGACTHDYDIAERRAKLVAGPEVRAEIDVYIDEWFKGACMQEICQKKPGFTGSDDHEMRLIEAMIRELDQDMAIPDRPAAS